MSLCSEKMSCNGVSFHNSHFFSVRTFLLIILICPMIMLSGADTSSSYWEENYTQPYFDNTTRRDITVTIGMTALLNCRVKNLGDRAVSWIRKRDLHIMTIGILTYTNDQRFQAIHSEGSDEWSLRITSAQPRDTSVYECQVSTEPKISQAFRLNVVVSKAKILGNHELIVKSGSDINLTCVASQISNPPSFIYWYKGGRVINYSQRGGINVQTDRNTKTSKLLIAKATYGDSGNYTCAPSNSDASSILVHVIKTETQAASSQHGNNSFTSSQCSSHKLNIFPLFKFSNSKVFLILQLSLIGVIMSSISSTFILRR